MKARHFFLLSALIATASAFAQTYQPVEITGGGAALAISNGIAGGYSGQPSHATLWTGNGSLDVHPAGYGYSLIQAMQNGVAVGYGDRTPLVWAGNSAQSLPVPFAFYSGVAHATDGIEIGGMAYEGDDERGAGPAHALLWNVNTGSVVDLGKNMVVFGVGGGAQAGIKYGSKFGTACYWTGTSRSFVDLHPRNLDASLATDTNGLIQTGYVGLLVRVRNEAKPRDIMFYSAVVWHGSATSVEYLPSMYRHSFALKVQGDTIAGYGNTMDAVGTPKLSHAEAWIGADRTEVDLHALLPANMVSSRASDVDENGNIVGWGVDTNNVVHSFVWMRQ